MSDEKTWFDLVHEVFPDASKEEADFLLWERTAFPFAPPGHISKQLRAYKVMGEDERRLYGAVCEQRFDRPRDAAQAYGVTIGTIRNRLRRINECLSREGLDRVRLPEREEVAA